MMDAVATAARIAPLRVSLVQSALAWQDPESNRRQFSELLTPLADQTDLIVLPEMFTTGFTMDPGTVAERADGPTTDWLRAMAQKLDAAITGSIICAVGDERRNRMVFVRPDGAVDHYDKRHLFRMGGEDRVFAAGDASRLVAWRGFQIGLQVCYDLRFPVWSRRRAAFDYDLLLYVANWPSMRAYAWQQLLRARAIENQSYVVGVNRIGRDGNSVPHVGDSAAIDFYGKPLLELHGEARVATIALDRTPLAAFREKFPAHLDADRFELLP